MNRKKIDWLGQPMMESVIEMAEGNPGAVTVIAQLIQTERGVLGLMRCDDHNLRGSQLWIAYKDICDMDIESLERQITFHCQELAEKVFAIEQGHDPHTAWFSP